MLEQPTASHQPVQGRSTLNALPDLQGWGWNLYVPNKYDCGTATVTAWKKLSEESESLPGEDCFAYIISGLPEYLLAHGVREINVPQYYSRFHDEFAPIITEWTVERSGCALGIGPNLLTSTVRLAEGKGHIDHDELSIFLCDNRTLVICGSRGEFIVDMTTLFERDLERTPPKSARVSIDGFEIPEASPAYQFALRRFIAIFDQHTDTTLASYTGIGDGRHTFETDCGRAVYVRDSELSNLARMSIDETELRRVHTYDLDDETYQSVWDGETASHALDDETYLGAVVGFEHTWTEKEHIMSGGLYQLESKAKYWCFKPRPDRYSHYDFQIQPIKDVIDTFGNDN